MPLYILGMEEFFEDEDDTIQQGWYDIQAQEIKEATIQSLNEEINQHVADEYFLSATAVEPLTIRNQYLYTLDTFKTITETYASSDLSEHFHKYSHEQLQRIVDIPGQTVTYQTLIDDKKVVQDIDESTIKDLHNFEWVVIDYTTPDGATEES
jgi:hypothetical protein